MRQIILSFTFSSILVSSLFAAGPFAEMINLEHATCVAGGSVEFVINGNPDDYTFYWEHGPQTLVLDDLEPGNYTFVVINPSGCEEQYPIDIFILGTECSLNYTVRKTRVNCMSILNLVFSIDGAIINENLLNIVWDDGFQGGLQRTFPTEEGFLGCVVVSMEACCTPKEQCFAIPPYPCAIAGPGKDHGIRGQVIVNEVGRASFTENVDDQFVELLILGNGVCGDSFDMSGYLLDDNNGFLIHGNSLLTNTNIEKIGINTGYLSFKKGNPIWEKIPNGSLLVIQPSPNAILIDDSNDENGDHVYVVSASDDELFSGHTGQWNEYNKTFEYGGGQPLTPSWDLIEFAGSADGLQVRTRDGLFCHGVSCGQSGYSSEKKFEMWLLDDFFDFAFTGDYWFNPESFTEPIIVSPGQSNSTMNAELIASFSDCGSGKSKNLALDQNVSKSNDVVSLFPNPTDDVLNVKIKREIEGRVTLNILNTVGQVIYTNFWEYQSQQDVKNIQLSRWLLPSGWYTVRFDFDDGTTEYRRLIVVF